MDTRKFIHGTEYCGRALLDTICRTDLADTEPEVIVFPLEQLYETFSSGQVKGDTLLDFSLGPMMYQLFSACEVFKDITILNVTDHDMKEFDKWINMEFDIYDWTHILEHVCHIENNKTTFKEKEKTLRKAVKRVLKCDATKPNPLDPVVIPKVDCLLSLWCLSNISGDESAYESNLKNLSSLIKLGGHMILIVALNKTYYSIGDHKFFTLKTDENYIKNTMTNLGYVIVKFNKAARSSKTDFTDYEHVGFFVARKVKET